MQMTFLKHLGPFEDDPCPPCMSWSILDTVIFSMDRYFALHMEDVLTAIGRLHSRFGSEDFAL